MVKRSRTLAATPADDPSGPDEATLRWAHRRLRRRRRAKFTAFFLGLFFIAGQVTASAASPMAANAQVVAGQTVAGQSASADVMYLAVPSVMLPAARADGSSSTQGVCDTANHMSLLPVDRWSDATSFHSRLGWKDITDKTMRDIQGLGLVVGNFFTSITSGMVQFAANFCPKDRVGGILDQAFGSLGNAATSSGLVAGMFGIAILAFGVAAFRGAARNGIQSIAQKALVVGLLVIMTTGAAASTGGGLGNSNAPFKPGTGSPGWFMVTIDQTISTVATLFVDAANTGLTDLDSATDATTNDVWSCDRYLENARQLFKDFNNQSGYSATTALAVSSLWETSGLRAWRNAQFGAAPVAEGYDKYAYCRLLEWNANSPVVDSDTSTAGLGFQQRIATWDGALSEDQFKADWKVWSGSANTDYRDRILVALIVCKPNGTAFHEQLFPENGNSESIEEECKAIYGDRWEDSNNANAFDWESGGGKIDDKSGELGMSASDTAVLKSLHGVSTTQGVTSVISYLLGAFCLMLIFGGLSLAIVAAKLTSLVMMVGMIGVLIASVMPGAGIDKVVNYAKKYVGISFLVATASLLLTLIAFFTTVFVKMGGAFLPGGDGGLLNMLWSGLAPVLAAWAAHGILKQLKVPSPMVPGNAMAMAKSAMSGRIGDVMAAGLGDFGSDMLQKRHKRNTRGTGTGAGRGRGGAGNGGANKMEATPQGPSGPAEATTPEETDDHGKAAKAAREASKGDWLDEDGNALGEEEKKALTEAEKQREKKDPLATRMKDAAAAKKDEFMARNLRGKAAMLGSGVKSAVRHSGTAAKWGAAGALAVSTGGVAMAPLGYMMGKRAVRKGRSAYSNRESVQQANAFLRHKAQVEQARRQAEAQAQAAEQATQREQAEKEAYFRDQDRKEAWEVERLGNKGGSGGGGTGDDDV